MHAAGLSALLHCELAVDMRLPGAAAPWTTLHVPVIHFGSTLPPSHLAVITVDLDSGFLQPSTGVCIAMVKHLQQGWVLYCKKCLPAEGLSSPNSSSALNQAPGRAGAQARRVPHARPAPEPARQAGPGDGARAQRRRRQWRGPRSGAAASDPAWLGRGGAPKPMHLQGVSRRAKGRCVSPAVYNLQGSLSSTQAKPCMSEMLGDVYIKISQPTPAYSRKQPGTPCEIRQCLLSV